MTATALGLVITAAFFHAIWNVAAKTAGGDARFALLSSLLVIAVWSPLTVWSAWSVVGGWGVTEWAVSRRKRHRSRYLLSHAAARVPIRGPHGRVSDRARHGAAIVGGGGAGAVRRASLSG
jgi:hypothetical protein